MIRKITRMRILTVTPPPPLVDFTLRQWLRLDVSDSRTRKKPKRRGGSKRGYGYGRKKREKKFGFLNREDWKKNDVAKMKKMVTP